MGSQCAQPSACNEVPRTSSCSDRSTSFRCGAHRTSLCCNRSTCARRCLATRRTRRSRTTLQDMTCRGSQDTSFLYRSVNTRFQDTFQDTLLWLHPCGPTVDRLRRSTVGSGTREDVATTYELPVLHEVVYIAPVPAVFAAQLSPCAAPAPVVFDIAQPLPLSQHLRL